jgi:hypothetical protein
MRDGIGHRIFVQQHRQSVVGELVDFDKQASRPLSFLVQCVITQSTVVFLSSKTGLTDDDSFFVEHYFSRKSFVCKNTLLVLEFI